MKQEQKMNAITKELSRNDTGETGAHQAGILVPKKEDILSFFPSLDPKIKNPRQQITFTDNTGTKWLFSFIYYNNRFFNGTRNEYRLTGMTGFFRCCNLHAGDSITLSFEGGRYCISYKKVNEQSSGGILKLGSGWKIVSI